MATRRRGRPPGRPRAAHLKVRLHEGELEKLKATAASVGLSLPDYVRRELGCEIDGPRAEEK